MTIASLIWLLTVGLADGAMTRQTGLLLAGITAWFVLSLVMTLVYAFAAAVAPLRWLLDSES